VLKRLFSVTLLGATVLLSACVAPQLKMTPEAAVKRGQSDVLLAQPSDEIRGQFVASTAGGTAGAAFGLLGALIGSAIDATVSTSRLKDAEAGILPFKAALNGYKFSDKIKADLVAGLQKAKAEKINPLEVRTDVLGRGLNALGQPIFLLPVETRDKLFTQTKADSIILVGIEYSMTPERAFLQVSSMVMVVKRGDKEFDYLHRWPYIETKATPDGEGTPEQRWLLNNGAPLVKAMDEARSDIVDRIVADLFPELAKPAPAADPVAEPKK
jgi:hypothetical protein